MLLSHLFLSDLDVAGLDIINLSLVCGFSPTDIPQAEADALVAFAYATNYKNWTSPWVFNSTAAALTGVTVVGGHVSKEE